VLRIPTTIPDAPRSTTIGKRICERLTASSSYCFVSGGMITGASRMNTAVTAVSTRISSQRMLEATRQARARSPFSSSSLKTGTNAPESAASPTRTRIRFGIWNATVNALIGPRAPK
jgi:hypothetical protein